MPADTNSMDDQAEQFGKPKSPNDDPKTLRKVITRLLTMLDFDGISLDANLTDQMIPANVVTKEGMYDVRQEQRSMGS